MFWNANEYKSEDRRRKYTPPCLRKLHDKVVNATKQFIVKPTEEDLPGWIPGLPDGPDKDEKIASFYETGSPNTGNQFIPHVSLNAVSFADSSKVDYAQIAETISTNPDILSDCDWRIEVIGVGSVGMCSVGVGGGVTDIGGRGVCVVGVVVGCCVAPWSVSVLVVGRLPMWS